jgi:cytochrome-b5 reductase
VVLLAGGTGITPMLQMLHALLGSEEAAGTRCTLVHGARTAAELFGHATLSWWAEQYPERFAVHFVLSKEPQGSGWKGERGYIDAALLRRLCPPPAHGSVLVAVCGPPPFYSALTGPRTAPGEPAQPFQGALKDIGFTEEQTYKF